jgi:hypothetical protein
MVYARGRAGRVAEGFCGVGRDLMQKKNEKGYMDGPGSNIVISDRDVRSKFGYATFGRNATNTFL